MNKRKHAQVWGIAGLDEILISKDPLTPGGKTPVRRVLRPGYFGSNVAVGLADQDIHTTLVTAVGRDREGKKVLKFLRNRGVVTCEARLKGRPTAMSHILAGNGDRTILPTQGSASEAWTEDDIPWTLADQKIYDWLALGHLPADKDGRITRRVIRAAHRAGIPVSWTPGSTQLRLGINAFADVLPKVKLMVLNLEEAVAFGGLPEGTVPEAAALALADRAGKETIVAVTNGGKTPSACFAPKHPYPYIVPPVPVDVVDTTGAGDGFHAGLAAGLINGLDLRAALEMASQVAATVCTFWGSISLYKGGNGLNGRSPRPAPAIRQVDAHPWYT